MTTTIHLLKPMIASLACLIVLGFAVSASAQTTSTSSGATITPTPTPTYTPTAPNTGLGGDATGNLAVLAASGLVTVLGGTYLLRSRREQS